MMHFERSVKDKRKHEWQVNYFMGVIIEKKGQRCVASSQIRLKSSQINFAQSFLGIHRNKMILKGSEFKGCR